jgi:polysaccharide biosynthesis protein PelE
MYRWQMLVGVSAEALAALLLWLSGSGSMANWMTSGTAWGFVFASVAFHSISSYYLAGIFWQSLPRRYKVPVGRSLGFLFAFLWILPVLGVLGILWSITRALKRPRSRLSKNVEIIVLPELPFSPPAIFPVPPYSEGALRQIVSFAERPLKRLKAVMATRYMSPRQAMTVWSKATRDPVDDVRLLAYAMRDDNEKKLPDHALALIEVLPKVPARARNAHYKMIAALCWELVYHRLVQGAVRQHWLQTARHHLELVLAPLSSKPAGTADGALSTASTTASPAVSTDVGTDATSRGEATDAESWLLYGRVLFESGELEGARSAFLSAEAAGIERQRLLPWLAEIAFQERRFVDVKHYLSMLPQSGEKGRELALVTAWWNK